jgi:hypothetical protein
LRGNGDEPPKGKKRTRKANAKVTAAIEQALAEIFTAPAMATAIVRDDWATQHFTVTGKELAHRIAITSERHSQLRKWCEAALETESVLAVALAVAAYAIPPMIHWNILPGPDGLLGVPRKPSKRRRPAQAESPPSAATEWDHGETEQQQYERAQQAAANGNGESVAAEFSDDDEIEPPTFNEIPYGE